MDHKVKTIFKFIHASLVISGCLVAQHGLAADTSKYVREALVNGSSSGVVMGQVADEARTKLNATGSLFLKVVKKYDFEQQGCARLELQFKQAQALLPGAVAPTDYQWVTQLSVCGDGQPPASTKRKAKT